MNKSYFFNLVIALLLTCFSVAAMPTECTKKVSIASLSEKERNLFTFLDQQAGSGRTIEEILNQCVCEGYVSAQELIIIRKIVQLAKNDKEFALANRKLVNSKIVQLPKNDEQSAIGSKIGWMLGGLAVGSIGICILIVLTLGDMRLPF